MTFSAVFAYLEGERLNNVPLLPKADISPLPPVSKKHAIRGLNPVAPLCHQSGVGLPNFCTFLP